MTQATAGKVFKGLYAAMVATLGMLATILVGNTSFHDITPGQWVTVGLFSLTAFGGVFGLSGWAGPAINGSRKQPPQGP